VSESQIFVGIALTFGLAVGSQILASQLGIPAIVVLLPVGFTAGALTDVINPMKIFGPAFSPMVSLAVAVILFDAGLDLVVKDLEGESRPVVHRLRHFGIPITWGGAAFFAWLCLGLSWKIAIMLGAILIVSGPTVVTPILRAARPGRKVSSILEFEGTTLDPLGALIAVVVYQALVNHSHGLLHDTFEFVIRAGTGVVGGAVGILILWILLKKLKISGALAIEAILATVILVAGVCDAIYADTGLVAAITMGWILANLRGADYEKKRKLVLKLVLSNLRGVELPESNLRGGELPEEHPMLKTVVQLTIGLLFISISATVTPASLRGVIWPSVALIACLVLIVRPLVGLASTLRTSLTRNERIFIGSMDPRGIIAASTASTFAAPLIALRLGGADRLLPVTFLVIVGTVAIYGLSATPLSSALGLRGSEPETASEENSPSTG
jgi:NhaP-type Na+/H+ or K+/H+ antiporter